MLSIATLHCLLWEDSGEILDHFYLMEWSWSKLINQGILLRDRFLHYTEWCLLQDTPKSCLLFELPTRQFSDYHHLPNVPSEGYFGGRNSKRKFISPATEKITVDQNTYSSAKSPISGAISNMLKNKATRAYLVPEKCHCSWSLALTRMVNTIEHVWQGL